MFKDYFVNKFGPFNKNIVLVFAFFMVSAIEIVAEFYQNSIVMMLSKPLLMPILIVIYLLNSEKKSCLYVVALAVNWLANIMFISTDLKWVLIASVLFMLHRVLIVIKIFIDVKMTSLFPVIIGSIPFLFLFLSLISMVYETMDVFALTLCILQSIFMTIMGGFALGNYILKNDEAAKMLLMCTLFFAINLFVLGVKFYYLDLSFLKPISMGFFVIGHFILYQFVILTENNKKTLNN